MEEPKTTTISTIAVQSGGTRIVIALLQSRDWLELKVLEMNPGLTKLGATLSEATDMLAAHQQVIAKINSKQSPVEDLLRQADQLIASQHARAEVYAAMAQSLSLAWQDVNALLRRREDMLNLNVKYHTDAAVCLERTHALELACAGSQLPVEVPELRDLLARLSEVKRSMLEALMGALQAGRELLDTLRQIASDGTLDSRPGQLSASTNSAISQVERWLEDLHDRRRALELSWQSRKTQLEQCLALALLTADLRVLEECHDERRASLTTELGDSAASARLLLAEHEKLMPEAKEMQEQVLKIVRATEQLAATGHFAGEEATLQAYQLLNTNAHYLDQLDMRQNCLKDAVAFFDLAHTTLIQLDNLERTLSESKSTMNESMLSQVQVSVNETCEPALKQGYALMDAVPTAKGVQNMIEKIESCKLAINISCSNLQQENSQKMKALNNFNDKYDQISLWLINTVEAFIQGNQDMGNGLITAKEFLHLNQNMLNEVQMKAMEMNAVLSLVPDLVLLLDEAECVKVERQAEDLRSQWTRLQQSLDRRCELSAAYVKVLSLGSQLTEQADAVSARLSAQPNETERSHLEEQYLAVTQLYTQLETSADNFNHRSLQTVEPYLCVERARLCVDSLRQRSDERLADLSSRWQHWQDRLDTCRQGTARWNTVMAESNKTVDWVSRLEGQLYPVLDEGQQSAKAAVRQLEERRERTLAEVRRAHDEVNSRIATADQILATGDSEERDRSILSQLKNLQERLLKIVTDYQLLTQMLISFFKNLSELEHTVQGLESQFDDLKTPSSLPDLEKALREHEASRQAVQELFKFALAESQQLIAQIRQQEPERAADEDVECVRRVMEGHRGAWERAWTRLRLALESQQQLGQFDSDLGHIHTNIDDLSDQLTKVKGQFGDDLAGAKATSLAFHYFEKTIELLEQRIETFTGMGETMLKSEHTQSVHVEQELAALRERWHTFTQQVSDTRQLIDISLQYFALVEEAEEWFREGSRLLMTIAKQSSTIRSPQEANDLLQEIELFLKPGESRQDERIQKISEYANQLYGTDQPDQLHQVKTESREMIDSFSQVSLELQQIVNFLNKPPEEQQMEIVGLQEAEKIEPAPIVKSPSPPPKKAKLVESESLPPNFSLPLHDATIDEGSRFTFECRVTGEPRPEVCWLKDSVAIDSNLDYQTRLEEDGLCSLTIEETFLDDSACFTCRATNHLGYAETTALMTVRESERECPPVFVRELESVSTREGGAASLSCRVKGTPLPTVQWYHDGACVDAGATYNNGEAVLSLERVVPRHHGQYCCTATNRLGSQTTKASLTVLQAPVFVRPPSNVTAQAGETVRLECEVNGRPEPQLQWTLNGQPLSASGHLKIDYSNGKAALTVVEAYSKDSGMYGVTASNSVGSASATCDVTVKGLPQADDTHFGPQPSKPSIPTALKDCVAMEGGRVRLDCIIIGQPEPEVIWYHEGAPVKESKEVQLLFQGDRCSLIIYEALLEDAGSYKVVAINSGGEASSTCHLTVQCPDPVVTHEPEGTKPLFISLLSDALATEADSVTLECAVTGDPTPSVSWFLNNKPLQHCDRIKVTQEPRGVCSLTISPVVGDDKGVYTARAANPLGEAKCFAHLIVKSAANLAPDGADTGAVRLEERSTVPAFTELFADQTITDGTPTKFECIVIGKPTPKVRWLYNDEPVSGKDFLVSVSGARQVLAIPAVSRQMHNGHITCTAENEAGRANCTAVLKVTECPSTDDLLSTIDQLNLSETSVFEMKREVFMQTSSHSQFGSGEPIVQVQGLATKTEQTSQKIGDKPAIQTEIHKRSEYHSSDGVEQKVDSESRSTNVVEPGALVPVRPSQRRPLPPRFISPIMGKIVDQGADVTFECIVEGHPTPNVSWGRNGKEVLATNTTWELNKARCELRDVTTADAGQYSCTAVNDAGSATCTADLVVKKNVFPPVFGRRLRADTVEAGRRTILEVEVTGTPDPTVTWYKDGQQIAASSSMYRLLPQGNSHRLIIEQAGHSHSGRYEVRATNGGGEARCSADLLIVEPSEPSHVIPVVMASGFPISSDFSSSNRTVSVTETFKSDKKVSLHVERTTTPLDPLFDLPTLNIKFEEPAISNHYESTSKKEEVMPVSQPICEIPISLPEVSEPVRCEETGIEESTISKKSALSFFKNIIKENEEESRSARVIEPVKKDSIPNTFPLPQPLYQDTLDSTTYGTSSLGHTEYQQSSQSFESIYTSDGFVLQPEPPPEIGFISQSQNPKKEDLAERVKKLEESHKALPQDQIPTGAVRIFPSPAQKDANASMFTPLPTRKPEQMISSDYVSSKTSFQEDSKVETKIPPFEENSTSETLLESTFISSPSLNLQESKSFVPFKVSKFEIQKKSEPLNQEVLIENCSSSTNEKTEYINGNNFFSERFDSLGPVIRPSADGIHLRPQSPRPSAEGIHMEKLWASPKQKDEYVVFPHTSPAPVQEHTQHFSTNKSFTSTEIKRSASPLPSATGLAMEKLWTPTFDNQRPASALSVGERPKSPSAEGLAMDKLWAHKTSSHKQVWPPQAKEEELQSIPLWANNKSENVAPLAFDNSRDVSVQKSSFVENNVRTESQSISKVESSFQSNYSGNLIRTERAFEEVTPIKPIQPYIPPQVPPESKIIYVAEARASHSVKIPQVQSQVVTMETSSTSSSSHMEKTQQITNGHVIEEQIPRPSEASKVWPPAFVEESKPFYPAPPKKEFQSSFQKQEYKKECSSLISSNSMPMFNGIPLEPGPPPEIGFAEPPPRRQSYVETIEQDLEKNLDKVPSKHLAGAVRIIPPPIKKEKEFTKSTVQTQAATTYQSVSDKKPFVPESISKPLPKLEPLPFKPDPPRNRPAKCPPPPRPSKFVKGSFTESDYESDCEAMRIPVKWNPWQSDSEEYGYKKVQPPSPVAPKRPHSVTGQAVPPHEFEQPIPLQGPSKTAVVTSPQISKSSKSKIIKTEQTYHKLHSSKEYKTSQSITPAFKPTAAPKVVQSKTPVIKPGSPPEYVEAPAPKHKPVSSKPGSPKSKTKTFQQILPESGYMADTDEPSRYLKRAEESSFTRTEQSMSFEQSRSEMKTLSIAGNKTLSKKESTKSEYQSSVQNKNEPPLEPLPFKPEPARPSKRPMGPPPPSPSKFIKGEFRESDYESEYEGKIRPIWRPIEPADDLSFRPVRPVLTPVSGKLHNARRTPTPPTEFEDPPNFNGPPRPKFEPIDKPKSATKVKEVLFEKTKLIRPTPIQPNVSPAMETIYATPASKPAFVLKPGSPPRMDYAPPPGYVEKSNIVNFTESTASSKRVVSVQQTTRVMQFGQKQAPRKENIPPQQIVSAYSKEKDYDSEVDGAITRTPYIDAERKRLKRVEEMKKKFLESEPPLQPGEPPQFVYSPEPSKAAYSQASKHMTEMTQSFKGTTQKFVSDIMTDIKSKPKESTEKSIIKTNGEEPQTYRDETRLSEYGSKHIDPETGLIYFKYDFGYEFGIVLPGEQKPGTTRKVFSGPSKKEEGAIDFPVIHETTQKKKHAKGKSVKWDPTSESEMSEIESERPRPRNVPFSLRTPSPSPSPYGSPFPSQGRDHTGSPWLSDVGQSSPVVRAVSPGDLPKKAPIFITPLRDIACVSGQPARFECIVLAEPAPTTSWSKDGATLQPSATRAIEYRNGVCRLTLLQAAPSDAGQYTCSATNPMGRGQTTASLQVPGERRTMLH